MKNSSTGNGHSIFDAISQLFGKSARTDVEVAEKSSPLSEMENSFSAALQQLNGKIEELRQQKLSAVSGTVSSPAAHAEERERRMREAHARILNDILAMHRKLATGIDPSTLEALATFLQECVDKAAKERSVPEVMLCCRSSILRRFHHEAGGVAWDEMERQLAAQNEAWPETTQRDPVEEEAAFERRRQLKYREMQNDFVNYELARSAQLIRGIERVITTACWQIKRRSSPALPSWSAASWEPCRRSWRRRI
jgi:hypothetical protein